MNESAESSRRCQTCGADLPLFPLVCDRCHALVHSEELARISHRAKTLEEERQIQEAREEWQKALPLLPAGATQAEWVRSQIAKLELQLRVAPAEPQKANWARRLGPLGPLLILLSKGKFLLTAIFKLKFLISLVAFVGVYWSLFGARFGISFALLVLLHELGHYVDIRRRGLPAEMPVFLPGLGAYVRWDALGIKRATRAAVSLAGPLAGLLGAIGCYLAWKQTGSGLWAALAQTSAWLNVLNLIPVWILDGGQAALALSRTERWILLGLGLLLWLGLGESIFFLVSAGAVYRLFTKDVPPMPAPKITAYYISVLVGLGVILHFVPSPR